MPLYHGAHTSLAWYLFLYVWCWLFVLPLGHLVPHRGFKPESRIAIVSSLKLIYAIVLLEEKSLHTKARKEGNKITY